MRQRVDAECRVPDQQPRHRAAPDQTTDRVAPQGTDEGGQDESGKEGDGDVVFVLKPDNWGVSSCRCAMYAM
jgi:hypothetical protein